ncbi:hypothetical protein [Clostridium fessum]|uniref:hypothetical protein n=1 Tax=Clostridium fessum TaxID=2126740 RepID=UPI0029429041|nr:hypothetical protein [Clostridium fessum]
MKKRIIITALSVMLASSSIIPAYAARPADAPHVEYGESVTVALYEWADHYIDELKSIEDIKTRYQRMFEIIYKNWESPGEGSYWNTELVDIYNDGKLADEGAANIIAYWGEKTETPCGMTTMYVRSDNPLLTPYLDIDGTRFYADIPTYVENKQDIQYLYTLSGEHGMLPPPEDPAPVTDTSGTWKVVNPSIGVKVIYDKDGSWSSEKAVFMSSEEFAGLFSPDLRFHICENGVLTPITREQALELGYAGIW